MRGRIYKIIHNQSDLIYLGSTKQELRYRWRDHKNNYKQYLKDNHSEISIYPYFKQYGIENFKMILVEEIEYEDRKELLKKEQEWINKLSCINKIYAYTSKEEKRNNQQIYQQTYKYKNYQKSPKKSYVFASEIASSPSFSIMLGLSEL